MPSLLRRCAMQTNDAARHAELCSLNPLGLDISDNVLYIGPYKAIGLYVWSLINEIECVRCSPLRS
jgi:hypothetical protein